MSAPLACWISWRFQTQKGKKNTYTNISSKQRLGRVGKVEGSDCFLCIPLIPSQGPNKIMLAPYMPCMRNNSQLRIRISGSSGCPQLHHVAFFFLHIKVMHCKGHTQYMYIVLYNIVTQYKLQSFLVILILQPNQSHFVKSPKP